MKLLIGALLIAVPVAVGFLPAPADIAYVRLFALVAGLSIGGGICGIVFHFADR